MNGLVQKMSSLGLFLLVYLCVPWQALADRATAPMPAPPREECTAASASLAYPRDGQTDVPVDARIVMMFDMRSCFFSGSTGTLRAEGAPSMTLRGEQRSAQTQVLFTFQPKENLKAETKYTFQLNDSSFSFTTGKAATEEVEPDFQLHVLLATIKRREDGAPRGCEITYQVQGRSMQQQAMVYVYLPSRHDPIGFQSGRIRNIAKMVPLGEVALPEKSFTAVASKFEDCSEKEACLYAAFEGPDGKWHGPKKSCVKPQIEVVKDQSASRPPFGCSLSPTLQPLSGVGWCGLLLLLPWVLRRRVR